MTGRTEGHWRGPAQRIRPHKLTGVSPRGSLRTRPEPAPWPLGPERSETWPDGDWVVRQIPGAGATKAYRCPGCDQEITPGTAHVVAWPAGGPGLRPAPPLAQHLLATPADPPPRLPSPLITARSGPRRPVRERVAAETAKGRTPLGPGPSAALTR